MCEKRVGLMESLSDANAELRGHELLRLYFVNQHKQEVTTISYHHKMESSKKIKALVEKNEQEFLSLHSELHQKKEELEIEKRLVHELKLQRREEAVSAHEK